MSAATARRAADFAALARQLADERANAGERLTELLRATPREEWPRLAENRELHNNGALERLSKEVHIAIDRQPQDALELSALGVAIAEALREEQYPPVVLAQIRAHAWKDRAQALWFNGKYDEAYDAIVSADEALRDFGTVAHDRALVRLVKATVLQNLQRFDESLALLSECRTVFEQHRDQKLLLHCGISEAAVLHRQRRFEEAILVLASLLDGDVRDAETRAAIHNNLANALIEVGRVIEANVQLSQAVALLTDAGNHVGALRTELATGRLLSSKGRTTEALIRLRAAKMKFAERGLADEAALCGLEVTATLLAENRIDEASRMFDEVRSDLPHASGRARVALAYLSERFAAHDATPAAVRHVSEYLAVLRREPSREFIALQ